MLIAVTALPHHFIGVHLRVEPGCPVHVLRAAHAGSIDVSVGADFSAHTGRISFKILFSPVSSTHGKSPFLMLTML